VTADVIGEKMAGPAIRAWQMALALHEDCDVRLVSTNSATRTDAPFSLYAADDRRLRRHVDWAHVIVTQGHLLSHHRWIGESDRIIVADIYDPFHLETLEEAKDLGAEGRREAVLFRVVDLNEQTARADFMMCASEKQRDFWLGQLAAVGRINPRTYDADESLRSLLAVVPFGVENTPPQQRRHAIKGAVPGIGPDDRVIIWGGGIYNWFDPLTLIAAVHQLSLRRPETRLFFLGVKHPNPDAPEMRMAAEARSLAESLGILDRIVFFNADWVPYEERVDYLLDADVGVSTHLDHLESAFSFRTRILDYFWAGLPVVCTEGDTLSAQISEYELGETVAPHDVDGLESALESMLFDDDVRAAVAARVREHARRATWQNVLAPLVNFCRDPRMAPDRADPVETPAEYEMRLLQIRIDGLEQSSSWRLTAPLRAVATAVARVRRSLRS
jgi:glycosyltransferase involved in cell wall biosynthesis